MKKVYNIRIECNADKYLMTDEEFCKGLKDVIFDELGDEANKVNITAELSDKDHKIAILETAVKDLIYNYVSSVYEEKWGEVGAGYDEQSEFYAKYHNIADPLEEKDRYYAPYNYPELLDIQYEYFIDEAEKELKCQKK